MRVTTLSIAAAVASSLLLASVDAFTTTIAAPRVVTRQSELYGVRTFIKNTLGNKDDDDEEEEAAAPVLTNLEPPSLETESKPLFASRDTQEGKRSLLSQRICSLLG